MSSRSLASARARRTAETAPPVSGNRPITSIGSQSAFSQGLPSGANYRIPPPPNNVRVAKSAVPPQRQPASAPYNPPNLPNSYRVTTSNLTTHKQDEHVGDNGLPFSKLSISDAIGLITLRLGRVEQWIIDTDHEREILETKNGATSELANKTNVPENHKLIDNSVLSTIVSRLDGLEKIASKNSPSSMSVEELTQIKNELITIKSQIELSNKQISQHALDIAKNTEQLFKFNRDLVETKDLLKTFMMKYDTFTNEVTQNFSDYEYAISELERKIDVAGDIVNEPPIADIDTSNSHKHNEMLNAPENEVVETNVDLKELVKNALADD